MSAASVNTTAARDALAWATQEPLEEHDDKPVWQWFWEAIHGDFNEQRSTGQIAMDAAISMVPVVDQLCDIRDLVANCRKLSNEPDDEWAWVALALTLIGLFPALGSLVKGALKIVFVFVRKYGVDKALDPAMTWVVAFLRRRDVQQYLRQRKVDEVFGWLARQVRLVASKVDTGQLLAAFDTGIRLLSSWVSKVEFLPSLGARAQKTLEMLQSVRKLADQHIARAVAPVQKVLDNFALKLERESLLARHGIVDAHNVHFMGTLPEAHAVRLMRDAEPPPSWLSKGVRRNGEDPGRYLASATYSERLAEGWPALTPANVASFVKGAIRAEDVKGPLRLYRVVSPSSRAMSDCWVSKEVFDQINRQGDSRTYWRKFLAVWPHWNSNGQFVTYDIPTGQSLKVWRGETASQMVNGVSDRHLEGGLEQVIFSLPRGHAHHDTMRYFPLGEGGKLGAPLDQAQYDRLSREQKAQHLPVREQINHPHISGPFETGWAATDYDAALPERIGLPALPGQTTTLTNPPTR